MLNPSEIESLQEIMRCSRIVDVALEYDALQTRATHPPGTWDKQKRFFLANKSTCCTVHAPTRLWPNTEMLHGRSLVHVATLAGIADKSVHAKRYLALLEKYPALRSGGLVSVEMLLKMHSHFVLKLDLEISKIKEKLKSKKSVLKVRAKANGKPSANVKADLMHLTESQMACAA